MSESGLTPLSKHRIRKSTDLAEAKMKIPLIEQRILAICISKVNPKKDQLENPYRFTVREYCELARADERGVAKELRNALESLKGRTLSKYDTESKKERIYGWVDKIDFWDSGDIDVYIHSELATDLLAKKRYAEYLLRNAFEFKSKYSFRIFELVESWSHLKRKQVHVDVLREMIGVSEDEYSRYPDFRRRILKKAISEVNSETDLQVEINEFRKNRKVEIVEFVISKSPPKITKSRNLESLAEKGDGNLDWLTPSKEDALLEKIGKFGIGAMAGVRLIEEFGMEKVEKAIERTISDKKEGKFGEQTNLAGVVINRIKDPDPQNISGQTTPQQLEERRSQMIEWLESSEIPYDPYDFSGNYVGVSVNGTIVNFMNEAFQSEVGKIINRTTAKSEA